MSKNKKIIHQGLFAIAGEWFRSIAAVFLCGLVGYNY